MWQPARTGGRGAPPRDTNALTLTAVRLLLVSIFQWSIRGINLHAHAILTVHNIVIILCDEHLCWLARCLRWCISGGINNQSPSSPQHRPEYPSGSQFTTKGIGISLVPSPILPSTCARSQKQKVTTGTAWERGSTVISITASFPVSDLQYLLGLSLGMRLESQILRTRC